MHHQRSGSIRLTLTLQAPFDNFNLTLISDPPLSETDILALLTLGKTTEELAGTERMIGTTEAASFATGQVQDIIEEHVAEIMGFERFQVDPYYSSSKASGRAEAYSEQAILGRQPLCNIFDEFGYY